MEQWLSGLMCKHWNPTGSRSDFPLFMSYVLFFCSFCSVKRMLRRLVTLIPWKCSKDCLKIPRLLGYNIMSIRFISLPGGFGFVWCTSKTRVELISLNVELLKFKKFRRNSYAYIFFRINIRSWKRFWLSNMFILCKHVCH